MALYFGHRKSIDIDVFSATDFQSDDLTTVIESNFPGFVFRNAHNPVGIFSFIDDVKVDFVRHHHFPLIDATVVENGIRLASIPDIAAMKIAAILKRGVKKDFYDLSELLLRFSIEDLINFYSRKYPNQQLLISVPQALTYFADAEESEDPISLNGQTWKKVKKHLRQQVKEYLQ